MTLFVPNPTVKIPKGPQQDNTRDTMTLEFDRRNRTDHIPGVGSPGHLVDRFRQSLDIARCDAGNRYSPVFGGVHRVLFRQCVHLFRLQTRVCEHADLAAKLVRVR